MIDASDILKANILIVDHQQADISLLESALRDAGFLSIASTMNSLEVCELHRKNRYNLILLDLKMSDTDGFHVLEQLKAMGTDGYLSVLVFSAHPSQKLRALQAGAKDFVAKPVDLAEVLLRVRNLIEAGLLQLDSALRTEQAETRTEQAETRTEQAETRIGQAETRIEQAETRIEQAETRTEEAQTRTGQAETRIEQAETRIEQAETRTEHAEARIEEAETRTEQAETRTDQAEARSELMIRASELSYRRLFETAKDGIMILDGETCRIRDVNPFLTDLLGFSHDEMVGEAVWDLSPFKGLESNQNMLLRLKKDGYVRYEHLQLETRAGRKIGVEFVSNVYRAEDRDMIQCNVRDITEQERAKAQVFALNAELEQRVIKRTEQLQAANHELESFSYSVSHDLRAPLRHIAGFAGSLVNDLGPAMAVKAREHLQLIEVAARRMDMMVDALLKMAVLRRQSLRPCHSDLNLVVDEVISMLQPECEGRDVEWRIAKLPALDCDPILMAQVFQNLLGNALKYSRGRASAVIEVDSIQQPGKPPVIFVRDNGAGFDLKHAEKLFGVFQRFHTDSEFEGTGVGLATVHRIIQKHGGMIWAESEPDHGATFYFALQMTEQIGATPAASTGLIPAVTVT